MIKKFESIMETETPVRVLSETPSALRSLALPEEIPTPDASPSSHAFDPIKQGVSRSLCFRAENQRESGESGRDQPPSALSHTRPENPRTQNYSEIPPQTPL